MRKKIRIGDLLVQNGVISEEQLTTALTEQKKRRTKLGRTLIDLGYLDEDRLLTFLSRQLQIPFVDLRHHDLDMDAVRRLPETHARRFRALVLEDSGQDFLIGMADPTDIFAVDELARILRRPVRRAVVRESELLRILDLVYRRTEEITNLAEEVRQELAATDRVAAEALGEDEAIAAPVAKLLASLFEDAIQVRASDIHIEPGERVLRIRLRVDGRLHEQTMSETRIGPALIQRIKLMAGLDISEKRLPQDGRIHVQAKNHEVDVRLSTLPTQYGESLVMRLLDQSAGVLRVDQLGMDSALAARLRTLLAHPHGMVLVTGPTGSGKTTTLYAGLSELNQVERKIITVEDPVEYRLPRICQVQVNPKIRLDFAGVLRSALRQDPDILMVGEIRDHETAQMALRAAITGHLVLSTLHTNDAATAALRLLDMRAEGYLVASALRGVIAQRLVRRICESCAEAAQPTPGERAALTTLAGRDADVSRLRRGRGCPYCGESGYRGRIGVYELLELDAAMADALRREDSVAYVHAAAARTGAKDLKHATLAYALQGVTTLEEVLRVAGEVDETAAPFERAARDGGGASSGSRR